MWGILSKEEDKFSRLKDQESPTYFPGQQMEEKKKYIYIYIYTYTDACYQLIGSFRKQEFKKHTG